MHTNTHVPLRAYMCVASPPDRSTSNVFKYNIQYIQTILYHNQEVLHRHLMIYIIYIYMYIYIYPGFFFSGYPNQKKNTRFVPWKKRVRTEPSRRCLTWRCLTRPSISFSRVAGSNGVEDDSKKRNDKNLMMILVGGWATPLKNMKVNADDDIPNIWGNKIDVPNHQPDTHIIIPY